MRPKQAAMMEPDGYEGVLGRLAELVAPVRRVVQRIDERVQSGLPEGTLRGAVPSWMGPVPGQAADAAARAAKLAAFAAREKRNMDLAARAAELAKQGAAKRAVAGPVNLRDLFRQALGER